MATTARRLGELSMVPPLAKEIAANLPGSNPTLTAIVPLTGAFGSTGNAIADVTGTFSQTILNNNFRALEDKVNAILAALKA
jgi:hypothetical protein